MMITACGKVSPDGDDTSRGKSRDYEPEIRQERQVDTGEMYIRKTKISDVINDDPFYDQFQEQYDVLNKMGIPTGRIVLDGWPHGFGSDGGWVNEYADWLEKIFRK